MIYEIQPGEIVGAVFYLVGFVGMLWLFFMAISNGDKQ